MIPKLYNTDVVEYKRRGQEALIESELALGVFTHATKCEVSENVESGEYTLSLETTVHDQVADLLLNTRFIKCKPNPEDKDQFFRITDVNRSTKTGIIKVSGKHVCYVYRKMFSVGDRLPRDSTTHYTAKKPKAIMDEIHSYYLTSDSGFAMCPFTFHATDSDFTNHIMSLGAVKPAKVEDILFAKQGSIKALFGGDFKFDNFDVYFKKQRGNDKGIRLRYGMNVGDASQKLASTDIYSSVFPFANVKHHNTVNDSDSDMWIYYREIYPEDIGLDPSILSSGEHNAALVDFTEQCKDIVVYDASYATIEGRLQELAQDYIKNNGIGTIRSEIDVTLEAQLNTMQNIYIGDIVFILLDSFGTKASAKVSTGTYDSINERWVKLAVGKPTLKLADYIVGGLKS